MGSAKDVRLKNSEYIFLGRNSMTALYRRWQKQRIEKSIKNRRVLLLNGSRQCGKTTLAKQLAAKNTIYRTLDDLAMRALAENDPHGFVQHPLNSMLMIDEIQRVPQLLSAIKLVVDEEARPGQYLLTGSANIQSLPSVQESLAGRITKIRLRPLTQGEIVGADPSFIERSFSGVTETTYSSVVDRKTMLSLALRGGFPEAVKLAPHDREQWHQDYINALLERDLRDIAKITQHHDMQELVRILAAWSGKFMDISAIGSGLSIRRPTIESYINALEALYIVERVFPWTHTGYERVGKQSKIYMTDSGMMSAILRYRLEQIEMDADRSGKLIETFIFNELAALVDASNGKYRLYHYRDREKREIDFLIERDDQALLGIEIKAGSAIGEADFKHLKWFRDNIAKDKLFTGIVLYTGSQAGLMGKQLYAIPMSAVWHV
jgi:predicted AAA+ superfamily ATPase